jgi:hypothetical protein
MQCSFGYESSDARRGSHPRLAAHVLTTLTLRPFAAQADDTFWHFHVPIGKMDGVLNESQMPQGLLTDSFLKV